MATQQQALVFRNHHTTIFKKSILAMFIMAASVPGFAQDSATSNNVKPAKAGAETEALVEEVLVTGMRESLETAQDIKRSADTVVDSITAKDLGSFPDKSVAEALQRVAGVTVNRFAASADTSHFSAEPSGVIVRGLNQVRTEFNGRDSFSANSNRGLSWGDISPELMAGVDTYKNQTAELIEGGIAGTVNMRTRLPFDQADDMYAVSVQGNYGDISEKTTPEVSALASHRWNTNAGEFGVLVNLAYSNINTASEGVQYGRLDHYAPGVYEDFRTYMPGYIAFRDNEYDRTRNGGALAFQWQDNDGKYVATLQYNRSDYNNIMKEHVAQTQLGNFGWQKSVFADVSDPALYPQPAKGTDPLTFGPDGFFQTGVVTNQMGYWSDQSMLNDAGQQFIASCQSWSSCDDKTIGALTTTQTRYSDSENITEDFAFNFKWEVSDTVHANFDIQRVSSTVTTYDMEAAVASYNNAAVDLTGHLPSVTLLAPTNVALNPGGLTNPSNYNVDHIMDHLEDSSGNELAMRADVKIDIDSGIISSLKLGARYADREQEVNWSTYNFGGFSHSYASHPEYFFLTTPANASGFKGWPEFYSTRNWESDFGSLTVDGADNSLIFADMDLMKNRTAWTESMSASALGIPAGQAWDPTCSGLGARAGEVAGTCFKPAEMVDISEVTKAIYVQLNFGGEDLNLFDKPLSGNIGVRYVETVDESHGGINIPTFTADQLKDEPSDSSDPTQLPVVPFTIGHYISAEDKAFADGTGKLNTASITHRNPLPSLNLKWDLTDEVLLRFAASRALSRPDVGNMRNYLEFSPTLPSLTSANDPLWIKDSAGNITGVKVAYKGTAQNPYLKPITADQIDLALEWYFADAGSFTLTVFEKKFHDYIQSANRYADITNNGTTRTVEITSPVNGDGAKVQGIEVAFQQFFDFMPAPFDGLGVQTNYTYLKNDGITNTNISSQNTNGSTTQAGAPDQVAVDALEGLSDHSYNFVLMYEKEAIAARLAYSWRSSYMVTALDCCVMVPIWNDDYGQLDASFKYKFNDNVELALQASNLLNEETTLTQQVTNAADGALKLPNAWFQNDRRFTVGLRLKY